MMAAVRESRELSGNFKVGQRKIKWKYLILKKNYLEITISC